MDLLLKPEQWTLDLYDKVKTSSKEYKISDYVIIHNHDDGVLLFHTISWSIYLLTPIEYENILTNDFLIKNYVVVPKDLNELEIADKAYRSRIVKTTFPTYEKVHGYVIFTTTACNAKCFYCYEEGMEKEMLTTKTADALIDFMLSRMENENSVINIQWFGGEPLLNTNIMDYISNKLTDLNVNFYSTIITNGFLLNDENIDKFNTLWRIRHAQITLDGLNEDYNDIKNYIYSDVDAFLTVINNIHNLLEKTNVKIALRINVGNHNIFKARDIADYLRQEFEEYINTRVNIHAAALYDIITKKTKAIDGFYKEYYDLKDSLNIKDIGLINNITENNTFKRHHICNSCMAFNGSALAILPNGKFSLCEHVKDEDIFGNIYEGVTDQSVIDRWQSLDGDEINFCREHKCPLHPLCARFFRCENIQLCDSDFIMNYRVNNAKIKLLNTYKYYLDTKENIMKNSI